MTALALRGGASLLILVAVGLIGPEAGLWLGWVEAVAVIMIVTALYLFEWGMSLTPAPRDQRPGLPPGVIGGDANVAARSIEIQHVPYQSPVTTRYPFPDGYRPPTTPPSDHGQPRPPRRRGVVVESSGITAYDDDGKRRHGVEFTPEQGAAMDAADDEEKR